MPSWIRITRQSPLYADLVESRLGPIVDAGNREKQYFAYYEPMQRVLALVTTEDSQRQHTNEPQGYVVAIIDHLSESAPMVIIKQGFIINDWGEPNRWPLFDAALETVRVDLADALGLPPLDPEAG